MSERQIQVDLSKLNQQKYGFNQPKSERNINYNNLGYNKQQNTQQYENISPNKSSNQTTNRKKEEYKKQLDKQFKIKTLEFDEHGNGIKDLRQSLINDQQQYSQTSTNLKKQFDNTNEINSQINSQKVKEIYNIQSKTDRQIQQGNVIFSSTSSLRFVVSNQSNDQAGNYNLKKDNHQLVKSVDTRHKRFLTSQNINNHEKEQRNFKDVLIKKVNNQNDDDRNQERKCISSKEIQVPKSIAQQTTVNDIQEMLSPLKIQPNALSHRTLNSKDNEQNIIQNKNSNRIISKQTNCGNYLLNSLDGISGLKGTQSQNNFSTVNNFQQPHSDYSLKKSVIQNIYLKDKDSIYFDEAVMKSKKTTDYNPKSSLGNNELPSLNFSATQKQLGQFQKQQGQNEQKHLTSNKDLEGNDQKLHHPNSITIEEYKKIKQLNGQKSNVNFQISNNESLRIQELIKERNDVMKMQKQMQEQNHIQQEHLQNEQFQSLIHQSFKETLAKGRNNSTSPFKMRQNKTKESQAIIISDINSMTKVRPFNQSINNISIPSEVRTIHTENKASPLMGSQPSLTDFKLKTFQGPIPIGSQIINQSNPSQTFHAKQTFNKFSRQYTKGSPTLKSICSNTYDEAEEQYIHAIQQSKIETQKQEEMNEKDLARQTHLVDYLQQQKINIREDLQQFLSSKPRVIKGIQRNCLMDQEQFFCIDDMFEEFKKNYTLKLQQIAKTSSMVFIGSDIGQNYQHSPIQKKHSEDQQNVQFQFSQKIPEEIMKQIVEVIISSLDSKFQNQKDAVINNSNTINEEKQQAKKYNKQESILLNIDDDQKYLIDEGLQNFYKKIQKNVEKYILPQTIIDRIGGFARLKQLIIAGVKIFNNYINSASKMIYIEEDDEELIDKYLMPGFCALVNEDRETLLMLINIFKQNKNYLSHYDFFTIKKITWDTLTLIKLDSKLKNFVIFQLENLRYEFFENPFEKRLKELGSSLMKSYELCNYFRNPNSADNTIFLTSLMPVLYKNTPFNVFYQQNQPRFKFSLNDRFFDHLQKFLLDELKETDSKSILDIQLRMTKLRIRAGVQFNFFSLINNEDSESFFNEIYPFLSQWIQKYNLSQMDSKAQDFKFLELFLKWSLNKQDYYSIMDSEPCLMHYVVNEFMIQFWLKGIAAYFEEKQINKNQYKHIITFLTQYLLFKREESTNKIKPNLQQLYQDLSPVKTKH